MDHGNHPDHAKGSGIPKEVKEMSTSFIDRNPQQAGDIDGRLNINDVEDLEDTKIVFADSKGKRTGPKW